jgi:hypothetical protein
MPRVLLAAALLISAFASAPAAAGKAAVRTLAYVVSECRSDSSGLTGRQELRIRRGNRPPVTVMEFEPAEPVPDPLRLCRNLGEYRNGDNAAVAGAFQRLAVSPNGSTVVFEVTAEFAVFPLLSVPAGQEGIYVVRADGRGLRRLGSPSRDPRFRITPEPSSPIGVAFPLSGEFHFSPDGRNVVYTDIGLGPAGEDAIQVMTLDLATGRRTQVTHLPKGTGVPPGDPDTLSPRFVTNDRIAFGTYANPDGLHPGFAFFTVGTDGSRLRSVPLPVAFPGSHVVARFAISGTRRATLLSETVAGTPKNAVPGIPAEVHEVFLLEGPRLIQLTSFERVDTAPELLGVSGRRAFFRASADPLGTNPTENCQLFSIDTLGRHLRQLTHFSEGERSVNGCQDGPPPGCAVGNASQDPVTGTVVFGSACDPAGPDHVGGQIFAMRPNGSGLRALTDTRGLVVDAEGTVTVELPGPFAYSGMR